MLYTNKCIICAVHEMKLIVYACVCAYVHSCVRVRLISAFCLCLCLCECLCHLHFSSGSYKLWENFMSCLQFVWREKGFYVFSICFPFLSPLHLCLFYIFVWDKIDSNWTVSLYIQVFFSLKRTIWIEYTFNLCILIETSCLYILTQHLLFSIADWTLYMKSLWIICGTYLPWP